MDSVPVNRVSFSAQVDDLQRITPRALDAPISSHYAHAQQRRYGVSCEPHEAAFSQAHVADRPILRFRTAPTWF